MWQDLEKTFLGSLDKISESDTWCGVDPGIFTGWGLEYAYMNSKNKDYLVTMNNECDLAV